MIELLLAAFAIILLGAHYFKEPQADYCTGVLLIVIGLVLGTMVLISTLEAKSIIG